MRDLSGRAVLVTGASGFIGAALASRLRAAGATVHGVSRQPRVDGDLCDRWWQADLADAGDVGRLLDGARPDVVFHLAAVVSGTRDLEAVLPMLHGNLVSVVNLLVAATARGVGRLVIAGSQEEPDPDGTWPVAGSPYAAAKFGAATYARMCFALYGTPVVWLRVFMVYGPGQRDTRKVIPYVTLSLLRGEAPALSSGRRPVDWIYVDDVVDALLRAAVAEGVEGQTPEIGSGTLVTVQAVVERLVKMANPAVVPRFGALPDRQLEPVRRADVSTAQRLGWQPRTPLDEGLRRTVEWYRRTIGDS